MVTNESQFTVEEAIEPEQLQLCYPVVQELRPHLTDEEVFVQQVYRQRSQGYRLMYIMVDKQVVSILGYRLSECLAWGKILYIDDFATYSKAQGHGYGGFIMRWAIEQARAKQCDQVHLDTGPTRHDAHRLYLKQGFQLSAYHMGMKL